MILTVEVIIKDWTKMLPDLINLDLSQILVPTARIHGLNLPWLVLMMWRMFSWHSLVLLIPINQCHSLFEYWSWPYRHPLMTSNLLRNVQRNTEMRHNIERNQNKPLLKWRKGQCVITVREPKHISSAIKHWGCRVMAWACIGSFYGITGSITQSADKAGAKKWCSMSSQMSDLHSVMECQSKTWWTWKMEHGLGLKCDTLFPQAEKPEGFGDVFGLE